MSNLVRVSLRKVLLSNDNLLDATRSIKLSRNITSRSTRSVLNLPPKPKPWPYQNKSYTLLNYFFDKTTARLDENSKIIVVDGPVAAGKTKFAKHLADELDMLYLPEANLDMVYFNSYGYDLRKLDALLPESCRSFDVIDFLRNPKHRHTARFQIQQYIVSITRQLQIKPPSANEINPIPLFSLLKSGEVQNIQLQLSNGATVVQKKRLSQYIDALAHLLSTGQGVILDRSVYSDFVFTEAMFSQGYLSQLARNKYYEFRDCTISELLRPHLVIYLDVPVAKVLENIKKRAISYEKDSPVLSSQYLGVMEKQYKQNYLKEISKHAELLIYDWSDEGDVEIVIEDIERIDFNRFDIQDSQLKDWVHRLEEEWGCLRHKYADKKDSILNYCNVPCYEVPELVVEALEADTFHKVMAEAPGEQYEIGYNTVLGDKGILFKTSIPHRSTLPLRERRSV